MSDYLKILLSNRAEPSQEPLSRAIEPEPSQSRAKSVLIADSRARAKSQVKSQAKRQDNITLYHYSQADFKDKIKVKFYGLNYYTTNDKNLTDIKRAFYYTKPEPEALLRGSKYLYIKEYPKSRLYNITDDIDNYLKDKTISEALYQIKKRYNGVIYNIGKNEVVNLFYDVKFTKKEVLKWTDITT